MATNSNIEWTESTWNPVVGCAKVSEGCRHCYAMRVAHRLAAMGQKRYKGLTEKRSSGVEWNGTVRTVPAALDIPLSKEWKKPRRIFVNSMSDLFHPDVSFDFIDRVFAVMALCPQHTFQILTKRPERMLEYLTSHTGNIERKMMVQAGTVEITGNVLQPPPSWPLPNVWLGVSVENQATADERIPILLQVPAAVRWLSMEPLLGPVDIKVYLGDLPEDADGPAQSGIDWVVVGGESGHKARPMHPDWVRSLRDQCTAAAVPFFFKQWGEWADGSRADTNYKSITLLTNGDYADSSEQAMKLLRDKKNITTPDEWNALHPSVMTKTGKKESGRILDGRTWDEMPEVKG